MRKDQAWEDNLDSIDDLYSKCPYHFYRFYRVTYQWFHSAMNLLVDPPRSWTKSWGWHWYSKKQYEWPLTGDLEDPSYIVGHLVGYALAAAIVAYEVYSFYLVVTTLLF
jgi:hypothetical protein